MDLIRMLFQGREYTQGVYPFIVIVFNYFGAYIELSIDAI